MYDRHTNDCMYMYTYIYDRIYSHVQIAMEMEFQNASRM